MALTAAPIDTLPFVPATWDDDCRYCHRYHRPCGRHEIRTKVAAPRMWVTGRKIDGIWWYTDALTGDRVRMIRTVQPRPTIRPTR